MLEHRSVGAAEAVEAIPVVTAHRPGPAWRIAIITFVAAAAIGWAVRALPYARAPSLGATPNAPVDRTFRLETLGAKVGAADAERAQGSTL
jgi:hypothetical protein